VGCFINAQVNKTKAGTHGGKEQVKNADIRE
jgi:hypothetical protein